MATITNLGELKGVENEKLSECFISNLSLIYQYALKDIEVALENKSLEVLQSLRTELFTKVSESLSNYQNKTLIVNRKTKHTAIGDIVQLGYSIVNNSPSREIDRICGEKQHADGGGLDDEVSKLSDILLVVSELNETVNALQSSVTQLKAENKTLLSRISSLEEMTPRKHPSVTHAASSTSGTLTESNNSKPPSDAGITDDNTHENQLLVAVTQNQDDDDLTGRQSPVNQPPGPVVNTESATDNGTRSNSSSQGFQQQRSERRQQQRQSQADERGLRPAPQTRNSKQVYLGHVDIHCSAKDVCDHFVSKGVVIQPSDVRQLGNGSEAKSFCVSVLENDFNSIIAANSPVIPVGIKARPFYPRKQRSAHPKLRKDTHSKGFQAAHPSGHSFRDGERRLHNDIVYSRYDYDSYDREWPRLNGTDRYDYFSDYDRHSSPSVYNYTYHDRY